MDQFILNLISNLTQPIRVSVIELTDKAYVQKQKKVGKLHSSYLSGVDIH